MKSAHFGSCSKLVCLKHTKNSRSKILKFFRAVVVAQLVERSLPIPEVCGLNPVIAKNL